MRMVRFDTMHLLAVAAQVPEGPLAVRGDRSRGNGDESWGDSARRLRVHVHLDWGRSPESWSELYAAGAVIDPDPYGYRALDDYVELSYSADSQEGSLLRFLRRGMARLVGFDMLHAVRNRVGLRSADWVVTHTEHEHLAVLLLLLVLRERDVKVVCQTVWLWDRWHRFSGCKKQVPARLLAAGAVHTVHSPANLEVARSVVGPERAQLVPFGIGLLEPVGPAHPPRWDRSTIRVLALGNDRDRDWSALKAAADRLADVEVRVRSRRRAARRIAGPRIAVGVHYRVDQYLADLAWCDLVVIPLCRNLHASGLTVMLEAVSAGRPVVVGRTGGLEFYATDMVTMYEPGSVDSLTETIVAVARASSPDRAPTGKVELMEAGFTATDYALRHALLLASIGGHVKREDVSARRSVQSAGVSLSPVETVGGGMSEKYRVSLRVASVIARVYMRAQGRVKPLRRTVTHDGVIMNSDIRDFVQRRVHFFGVYEHALTSLVRRSLREGDVFLDIGANVGYFSLLAGRIVGPSGRVLAIEADPEIHDVMVRNIELNPDLVVLTRQVAVTADRCRVTMRLDDARNLGSSVALTADHGEVDGLPLVEAAGETLREANFIKIDVEGAEAPILESIIDQLPSMQDRLTVAVELQDGQANFLSRFLGLGFRVYVLPNRYAVEHYLERVRRPRDDAADMLREVVAYERGHHDYVLVRS